MTAPRPLTVALSAVVGATVLAAPAAAQSTPDGSMAKDTTERMTNRHLTGSSATATGLLAARRRA